MTKDERYQDNVILKKEALQELLTNIKNYPIIDIDYVEENELDLETPNPESTIWNRFTEGTPCIKITYGDVDTDKGKIALANAETKENISRWQKDIINYSKELAIKEQEYSRWNDILKENNRLKEIKQNEINIYKDGQEALVENIINEIKAAYGTLDTPFNNRESEIQNQIANGQTNFNFIGVSLIILTDCHIDWAFVDITLEKDENNNNAVVVKSINYANGETLDENPELTFQNNFPSLNLSTIDPSFENEIHLYVLRDWQIAVSHILESLQTLEYNKNAQILAFPTEKANIEANYATTKQNLEKLYQLYMDGRSWLTAGLQLTDENSLTGGSEYENTIKTLDTYIKEYLIDEIEDKIRRASDKIDALETDIQELNDSIDGRKQNIQEAKDSIVVTNEQRLGLLGHKYVKVGSSINFDDNETGYQILVYLPEGDSNIPQGQTEGYYLYDSEQDTYIPWDQKFGTFRVTTNGKIYEVNINGLSEDNDGNHHIDGPLILDSPLFVYKNIGTDENPIIQKIQLAGNDANGGSPNDDGYGDKRYFWRSDGEWANELENNLKLTTHNSLATDNLPVNGTGLILGKGIYNSNAPLADILIQNTYGSSNIPEVAYSGEIKWLYQDTELPVTNTNAIYYKGERRIIKIQSGTPFPGDDINYGDGENQQYWLSTPTPLEANNNGQSVFTPYFGGDSSAAPVSPYTSANAQDWAVYTSSTPINYGRGELLYRLATAQEQGSTEEVYLHLSDQEIDYNTRDKYYLLETSLIKDNDDPLNYYVRVLYTPIYCFSTVKSSTVNQLNIYKSSTNNQLATSIDVDNGWLIANKVFNAVFNDYAEYRKTINLTPGHIVVDNDDGTLSCTTERLMPGAQVISDTFGSSMGLSDECQTPLAVAGRALVYTYQYRSKYHAGMAVCSAPGGTVDIMTREEIKEYPDCIIGIVSEIPDYDTWGTDNVKVNGRIWIKVK